MMTTVGFCFWIFDLFDPFSNLNFGYEEVNTRFREALEKIHINPDYLVALKQSWADQFRQAANVNEGDVEGATAFNYFMHCLSFPWKILFAFVPPPGNCQIESLFC
jgi:solute carrier family 8 (sodium/calcium exchanger)